MLEDACGAAGEGAEEVGGIGAPLSAVGMAGEIVAVGVVAEGELGEGGNISGEVVVGGVLQLGDGGGAVLIIHAPDTVGFLT